jgi:MFS family permease
VHVTGDADRCLVRAGAAPVSPARGALLFPVFNVAVVAGTADVAPDDQGVAAGLLASGAQLGTAVGVAVTTPLVAGAVPGGYRLGFLAATVVAVAGAAASMAVSSPSVHDPVRQRPSEA